jgi:PhzF family phenazine biosynthesis protein
MRNAIKSVAPGNWSITIGRNWLFSQSYYAFTFAGAGGLPEGRMFRTVPFHLIDVFAVEPLTGNPLAVVDTADDLPLELMQRIAREFNQSETTFVLPSSRADAHWRLRSFTPKGVEVFGAGGHNTLGAWWWLATSGRLSLQDGEMEFSQEIGPSIHPLSIWQRGGEIDRIVMRQEAPVWGRRAPDPVALAKALGLTPDDILGGSAPSQVVSTGAPHLLVPARDCKAVDHASPDVERLLDVLKRCGGEGCYVFSLDPHQQGATAYARFFNPTAGISEDPATGTAAGPLAAHLVRHGLARAGMIAIEQGTALGRPSIIETSVEGDAVSIAARCVVSGSGDLRVWGA